MAIVSPSALKGYFNTGDVPTESQFVDLVDTTTKFDSAAYSNIGDANSFYTATTVDGALDEVAANVLALGVKYDANIPAEPIYRSQSFGGAGVIDANIVPSNYVSTRSATYQMQQTGKKVSLSMQVSSNLATTAGMTIKFANANIPPANTVTQWVPVSVFTASYSQCNFGNFGGAYLNGNTIVFLDKIGSGSLSAASTGAVVFYLQAEYFKA